MSIKKLIREATFGAVISEEDRTIEVSISSEFPVKRYEGEEILDHTKEAIDFSRFPLPLIVIHDRWELNIGLIEDPIIKEKKLRGVMRFGERDKALDIWKDVRNGIIRGISIGYEVIDVSDLDKGQYHVTRWMPFEASLCSVPADPTVGVGRTLEDFDLKILDRTLKDLPESKRSDFLSGLREVTAKYETSESDDSVENNEPMLRRNHIERELILKKKELSFGS